MMREKAIDRMAPEEIEARRRMMFPGPVKLPADASDFDKRLAHINAIADAADRRRQKEWVEEVHANKMARMETEYDD